MKLSKAPRKPRKTPPIASKISFKIPGPVPCFGCTECEKTGKAFVSRTRPGVRLHCNQKHPELCATLPAIKKREPRRLSPEQKLANKLARKSRTTANLDAYMRAVDKGHAKIIEISKEDLDRCMSPTELVAPANLKEDHVTETEDLEWAKKGLAENLVAACDYICDNRFDTLGLISNFGVEWSPQTKPRDYHSEEVGPKPWHSPVSDLSVQNF